MRSIALLGVLVVACGSGSTVAPAQAPAAAVTTAASPPPAPHDCRLASTVADAGVAEAPVRHATPEHPGDLCAVADSNLQRLEDEILAWPAPAAPAAGDEPAPSEAAPRRPATPAYLDLVARRFALQPAERSRLLTGGLVVPARLDFASYAWAFHEIFQSELPLYVSVDAILHAVYAAHDHLLADREDAELMPAVSALVGDLACALPAAPYPAEVKQDLDVYLTVARSLDAGVLVPGVLGDAAVDGLAAKLVAAANEAGGLTQVDLFGRPRVIDFSQFVPRGHYAGDPGRERYFRAVMWLMRLEFNLVSRSSRSSAPGMTPDPRPTPREAALALALADLVRRAGDLEKLDGIERTLAALAGRREDVSVRDLLALRVDGFDAAVGDRVAAAIGDRWKRTTRIHVMPEGSTELPAIATLLGPRIVSDAQATRPLVHGDLPHRYRLGGGDFAYLLGQDRGLVYLADDLARFPSLADHLRAARAAVAGAADPGDLYSAWLAAIRGLAERPAGVTPTFMKGDGFADLRLDSAIAAYAQLRHGNVLLVGQPYDEGGCEIPDAWVEPAPATYRALIEYARRGAAAMPEARATFDRLARVLTVLLRIQELELTGRPLPAAARQFLGMIVEMTPGSTGAAPTYTGWWFDLFEHRIDDGLKPAALIVDVYTSSNEGVSYVGVAPPRLGLFVVDSGGPPRIFVGPVARGYVHHGSLDRRLDDEAAEKLGDADREEPWTAGYAVPAAAAPDVGVGFEGATDEAAVDVEAGAPTTATVELLDHHRKRLAVTTRKVRAGKTRLAFPRRLAGRVDMVHLQVGAWDGWAAIMQGCDCAMLPRPSQEPSP